MWCLSAYPKGIQDVGDIVSSVEHKQRFLKGSCDFKFSFLFGVLQAVYA